MRNQLAIDVLDKNIMCLMKTYQASSQDHEQLQSYIELLENTSVLTDIFCNFNQPITSALDTPFESLQKTLMFFNQWEKTTY